MLADIGSPAPELGTISFWPERVCEGARFGPFFFGRFQAPLPRDTPFGSFSRLVRFLEPESGQTAWSTAESVVGREDTAVLPAFVPSLAANRLGPLPPFSITRKLSHDNGISLDPPP